MEPKPTYDNDELDEYARELMADLDAIRNDPRVLSPEQYLQRSSEARPMVEIL